MMNREAIRVEGDFLLAAQELCTENGTLLTIDEIQTGFWYPEVLLFNKLGLEPDMVIVGKGMTAGFHPLACVLYRAELDVLEQYDAISTNGNASLASLVSLANLDMIQREEPVLRKVADRYLPRELSRRKKVAFHMTTFDRLRVPPSYFRESFVQEFFDLSGREAEYLVENADQTLKIQLLLLDVWGEVCLGRSSCEEAGARIRAHVSLAA